MKLAILATGLALDVACYVKFGRCSGDCIANIGNEGKQQNFAQPQPQTYDFLSIYNFKNTICIKTCVIIIIKQLRQGLRVLKYP